MNTDAPPILRPEEYQPTPPRPPRRSRLVPWLQVLTLCVVVVAATVLWFLFTAKAVRFESNVADTEVSVTGGIVIRTAETFLLRPGNYEVSAQAEGYQKLIEPIEVKPKGDQVFELDLVRLPGEVTVSSVPLGAAVAVNGDAVGKTPLQLEVAAGDTVFEFSAPRFISKSVEHQIYGMGQQQTIEVELSPDWAMVTIPTDPQGAQVYVDDADSGFLTPGPIEILSGEHTILLRKSGYADWTDIVYVQAGQVLQLDPVELELQGGVLTLTSEPTGASVSLGGEFKGTTPVTISVEPSTTHKLHVLLAGYEQVERDIMIEPGAQQTLDLELEKVMGTLIVTTEPEGVEVWVDGEMLGVSNESFALHAVDHSVELKKEGYAGYSNHITVQPGLAQNLRVRLLTLEEARLEKLRQVRTTPDGQEIVLLQPTSIRMGASRRQPGRRANEVFRTANLTRLFYMGVHEVTNGHFRKFAPGHDSGSYQGFSLNEDDQPVVNVSWTEAAFYCNFLSEQEGLEPFYITRGAKVIGFNPNALGYRLPSESEWSWAARHVDDEQELLHFPWGEKLPPPTRHGNYADRAAQHVVSRILFDYNDNYTVTAPVGTFGRNVKGLTDIGGNVAEWMHDFYFVPEAESTVHVLGPNEGEYHVIRGSSYLNGTITDVRLSFRDYGVDGRQDVGFRIARYAE